MTTFELPGNPYKNKQRKGSDQQVDEEKQNAPKTDLKLRRLQRFRRVAIVLALLCVLISGVQLLRYYLAAEQTQSTVSSLKEFRARPEAETPVEEEAVPEGPDLAALRELNPDFVGWLSVEGTRIDYPVMQSGTNNPEKYLRRSFYGDYDINGTPFLDAQCSVAPDSDHLVIYGHNMHSGIMFHDILLYKDKAFLEAHPYITLETPDGVQTYEIFAAYLFDATIGAESFEPHRPVDFKSADALTAFLRQVRARAAYSTEVEVTYGDKLLTLATCDKARLRHGRMIVVAKLLVPEAAEEAAAEPELTAEPSLPPELAALAEMLHPLTPAARAE